MFLEILVDREKRFQTAYNRVLLKKDFPKIRAQRNALINSLFQGIDFSRLSFKESRALLEDVATTQRLADIIDSNWNRKSYVLRHAGKKTVFNLPVNICRKLNLSLSEIIFSHLLFLLSTYYRSIGLCSKVLLEIFGALLGREREIGGIYYFSFSPKLASSRDIESVNPKGYSLWSMFLKDTEPEIKLFHSCAGLSQQNRRLQYTPSFHPRLSLAKKPLFLIKLLKIGIFYLFFMVTLNWKKMLIIDDVINTAYFQCLESCNRSFVFLYQGSIYRPLWSWEAEKKNASVSMHFYSSNSEPFIHENKCDVPFHQYSCWPEIVAFNHLFCDEIKSQIKYPTTVKANATYFFEDNDKIAVPQKTEKLTLALFDIAWKHPASVCPINKNYDYLSYFGSPMDFYQQYYSSIIELSEVYDCELIIKPKRYSSSIMPDYLNFLEDLNQKKQVNLVSHEISAFRLLDHCDAGIVQPFTSIGFYNESQTPVTFYDPFMILDKNLNQQKGQNLCSGSQELADWLFQVKNNSKTSR